LVRFIVCSHQQIQILKKKWKEKGFKIKEVDLETEIFQKGEMEGLLEGITQGEEKVVQEATVVLVEVVRRVNRIRMRKKRNLLDLEGDGAQRG